MDLNFFENHIILERFLKTYHILVFYYLLCGMALSPSPFALPLHIGASTNKVNQDYGVGIPIFNEPQKGRKHSSE
jgi:hypothetical protein